MSPAALDIKAWAPRVVQRPADPLLARAQRLWPDDERNQREWLRAVGVVRKTTRGWRLDNPVKREAQQ